MALNKVTIDKLYLRNIGYRIPLAANIPIPLPSDKILGAPGRSYETPIAQQLNAATHLMTAGSDLSIPGLGIEDQWSCTAYSLTSESDAINQAGFANLDHGCRLDQGIERTMHDHPGFNYESVKEWAVKYYERIWQRFQSEKGLTHPSQHNWFGDYFFSGLGSTRAFNHYQNTSNAARMDLFKTLLTNESNARRKISYDAGSGVYSLGGLDEYYARGLNNYVNRFFDGYYNTADLPDVAQIYHILFSAEQHNLANAGTKVVAFDFPTVVDGASGNANGGVHLRMPLNPVHNVAISSGWSSPPTNGSWQVMHSFFTFLLMNGSIVWTEMFTTSNNISNWSYNVAPSIPLSVVKSYQTEDGRGPFRNWDNPTFPEPNPKPSNYRGTRVVGDNLVFAGAKYYSEISMVDDRISGGTYYAENSYSINGGSSQNGYNGTNVPTYGSLGNARISDKNNRNYNNTNALELCKLGKPVVLRTVNTGGTKQCLILCNPYAKDSDTTVYTVKDKDGVNHTTAPLEGDKLYILKID